MSLTTDQKTTRLGRITGSEVHKLMGAKGLGKTGETYIIEKAAEYLTGEPVKQDFTSQATSWGIDHEPEAIAYFEAATGIKIIKGVTLWNGLIAGTPDGIIDTDPQETGFEIKCPFNSGNHLKNLSIDMPLGLLDLRPEYYWQCVAYMWLTGLKKWKFCSYDPRFKDAKRMLILNITLDESHLELMKKRVNEAMDIFNNLVK
jgi:hypothetical protein